MIKFVYFDVGGVVIRDFTGTDNWDKLKFDLGIKPERFGEFDLFWKKYNREICLTRRVDSLLPLISQQFGVQIPKSYFLLRDGFVSRFEKNPSIWPVIDKIKQKAAVGLLTDMYPGMFEEIEKHGLFPDVVWDVVLDSSKVGYKKPDREIFELAEKKAGFLGSEILFIENNKQIIKTASVLGWQTHWYDSSDYGKSSQDLLSALDI